MFLDLTSPLNNSCSVQKKFILKNGIHKVILSLIAGNYSLVTCCNFRMHCSDCMFGASNVDRLRNFIKNVYVDRRFAGERTFDKTQRVKTAKSYFSSFCIHFWKRSNILLILNLISTLFYC